MTALVDLAQRHAREEHGMELSAEQVMALAKPVVGPTEARNA